ncbi:MAG: hypothetical protein AAB393_06560, partial [Bacteroidota bacterium]
MPELDTVIESPVSAPKEASVVFRRLRFPRVATIGAVETACDRHFHSVESVQPLIIDLSACTFVEVATLVYLVALVRARHTSGHSTRIHLPTSRKVRDFMRVWEFAQALEIATDVSFRGWMCCPEDKRTFGESLDHVDLNYAGRILGSREEWLLSREYFAIRTVWNATSSVSKHWAHDKTAPWKREHIKSVLARHLCGPEGYFASRVFFELMKNGSRHPNARIIQTASRFERAAKTRASGQFTLIVWDDGVGMVDTLREAIRDNRPIRSSKIAWEFPATYEVRSHDSSDKHTTTTLLAADFEPNQTTSDALVLVATILPGITRCPEGTGHEVAEDLAQEDPRFSLPGMGLFVLVNTVVDVFGGAIVFRTGRFLLSIKRG